MNISGHNQPEPCYGIGAEELVQRWIARERAQLAAGLTDAAQITKMMRREAQEALGLVVDPAPIIAAAKKRRAHE